MNDYYEEQNPRREKAKHGKEPKHPNKYLLTTIQITTCCILLFAAVILRFLGGDMYLNLKEWYKTNSNQSIVAQQQLEQVKTQILEILPPTTSAAPVSSQMESK